VKISAAVLTHSRTGYTKAEFSKVVSSYKNHSVEGKKKIKKGLCTHRTSEENNKKAAFQDHKCNLKHEGRLTAKPSQENHKKKRQLPGSPRILRLHVFPASTLLSCFLSGNSSPTSSIVLTRNLSMLNHFSPSLLRQPIVLVSFPLESVFFS
jgi:hypothetical protein